MKKIGLFCVALLACGSLAGCGQQQHHSNKNAAKISRLKAENSSLKAKKSSHHKREKVNTKESSNTTTKASTRTRQGKNSARDPKEVEAAKAMRDYDPEWWDSLSPEEQQYWAHHTAYSSNEDFMYAPGLYEKHLIHQQPFFSSDDPNSNYDNYGTSGSDGQSTDSQPENQPTTATQ